MEHGPHIHETPNFWFFTVGALIIMAIVVSLFIWFMYIGHEPFEPVHDENPHASAASMFRTTDFLKI